MRACRGLPLLVGLVLSSCTGTWVSGAMGWGAPQATLSPAQQIELLRSELIPAQDSLTGYGPTFSRAGYEQLLEWNGEMAPETRWAGAYEALDIRLPCCNAAHPNRDEKRNCGCGHHAALYGASKSLLHRGFSAAEAQVEVDRWRAFYFPRERLLTELRRRALTDPNYEQALRNMEQQGAC